MFDNFMHYNYGLIFFELPLSSIIQILYIFPFCFITFLVLPNNKTSLKIAIRAAGGVYCMARRQAGKFLMSISFNNELKQLYTHQCSS